MADWSNLPVDLLILIISRINFMDDFIRFRMVCKSWRAIYSLKKKRYRLMLPSLLPLLMLMEEERNPLSLRNFFSPFSHMTLKISLLELHYGRCWGSSNGWLVTLNYKHELHLFDPLTQVRILLPSLLDYIDLKFINNFPDLDLSNTNVDKVVISSGSSLGDCVVLAICYGNNVAFSKPGGESWTPLQCGHVAVHDAIYFGGKFYVASNFGDVIICDSNGSLLKTVANHLKMEASTYIAELGGQIHVIRRLMFCPEGADPLDAVTVGFNVYKLDKCKDMFEAVKTLGNWSIFVGSNYSFSISGTDYPSYKSNCIYFTDHRYRKIGAPYEMGIYSLDDDDIQPLFKEKLLCSKRYVPVWIKPTW